MRSVRAALPLSLALLVALLAWLLLRESPSTGDGDLLPREDASDARLPTLRGATRAGSAGEATRTSAAESAGSEAESGATGSYDLEVLDYREAGVAGVEVFHEVDIWDSSTDGPGEKWKTLASGTTDAAGHVRLGLDRHRRPQAGEGRNHRLRVVPPKEREDLAPTWRIWMSHMGATFRFVQTHVIAGRVLDAAGEPVWAATVWVGPLPDRGTKVNDPGWLQTKTDPDGYFRFAGIPTTSDWHIGVWAVAPGEAAPKSTSDIRGAQTVALDEKQVEIRLP